MLRLERGFVMKGNDSKWMRKLSKEVIEKILAVEPNKVKFHVQQPSHVVCTINVSNEVGVGVAICSALDKSRFSLREGKERAAKRALKALETKQGSEPIRTDALAFPRGWKRHQIKHVMELGRSLGNKSWYILLK